ncbi:hypothetical protein SPAN111604_11960 [Sphingomonas antarctica]|uniref:hypothetical protein n=1 Tax=Sphingomonas antarctica TaxID=2040274 RepID=UPI0039EBAB93
MSMLTAILEAAAQLTGITDQELATWREQALEDTGDDYLRLIRERQLASWTGSSTPISQQISNSEQHLDKLLEGAMPDLRRLLPRLFAIEIKQRRVDRLKEEYASQRAGSLTKSDGGLHVDYVTLIKMLHALGAGPSKVRQWAYEDLVIIADLARWKAADPRYEDGDNPWVAIRAVYADRTLEKVPIGKKPYYKSTPGTPPRERPEEGAMKYWRFGKSAAPSAPVVIGSEPTIEPCGDSDPQIETEENSAPTTPAAAVASSTVVGPDAAPPLTETPDRPDLVANRQIAAALLAEGRERFARTGQLWYRPAPVESKAGDDAEPGVSTDPILRSAKRASETLPSTPLPVPASPPTPSITDGWLATAPPAGTQSIAEPAEVVIDTDHDFGLPDDVTPEAAQAYYAFSKQLVLAWDEWREKIWPFAKADLADPASVAAMVAEFERVEREATLDELSQKYLEVFRRRGLADANEFLVDHCARRIILEVATGYDYERHRERLGYPRPSQWK